MGEEISKRTKQNKTKQNKIKQNKTKQNKTKQNKTKQNKTKQNKTKQNKTKQNKTKQNKTKQNKTKQNKTKQNKTNKKSHSPSNLRKLSFHSPQRPSKCLNSSLKRNRRYILRDRGTILLIIFFFPLGVIKWFCNRNIWA